MAWQRAPTQAKNEHRPVTCLPGTRSAQPNSPNLLWTQRRRGLCLADAATALAATSELRVLEGERGGRLGPEHSAGLLLAYS